MSPRSLLSDYRSGALSVSERNLLTWLRMNGNPYGVATVDLELLAKESFNTAVDKSYINRLMLSLKRKRYIWYEERKGRRGSFEVKFPDWILPNKTITTLEQYFNPCSDRGGDSTETPSVTEVCDEVKPVEQRLKTGNPQIPQAYKDSMRKLVRGSNKETETESKKETNSGQQEGDGLAVSEFKPRTAEHVRCREIAQELGDDGMEFYIGTERKHGMAPLEEALEEIREVDITTLDHPPSYFNSLVQRRIKSIDSDQKQV